MVDQVIDVGQTGTRARYAGATVRGEHTAVPLSGPGAIDALVAHLRVLTAELRPDPGGRALVGVSGLGDGDGPVLATAIREALGVTSALVASDRVTGYLAAVGTEVPAVVVTAGTGVVALGADHHSTVTIGGAGWAIDDDGGGFWIGRQGIQAAARALENRGPETSLVTFATERFGPLPEWPAALHREGTPVAAVASFARDVAAATQEGDAVAEGIWRAAASEVFDVIRATSAPLSTPPGRIAIIGGLVSAGEILLAPIAELCSENELPALEVPLSAPLDGAAAIPDALDVPSLASLISISEEP